MNGSQDLFTSTVPDAAAVAAQRGRLRYYLEGQSTSVGRYILEQSLFFFLRGVPGLVGIGLRAVAYRLIMHSAGLPVIEDQVRLCQPANIHLGRQVYIDHGVYLHACPQGIFIGDETFVMHGSELHVYNFRGLSQSGIWVGRNCFIGEFCLIRGQGGCTLAIPSCWPPGSKSWPSTTSSTIPPSRSCSRVSRLEESSWRTEPGSVQGRSCWTGCGWEPER